MRIDGKSIQQNIKKNIQQAVEECTRSPQLDVFYAGDDPVIQTFLRLKEQFAESIGVNVKKHTFPKGVSYASIQKAIQKRDSMDGVDAMVVQLPLPETISEQELLDTIPIQKDADVLSQSARERFAAGESPILPPVVGAIKEVFSRFGVSLAEKSVAVVGNGKLVGQPVVSWLKQNHSQPKIFEYGDNLQQLDQFNIIISGAGDPHIITPTLVKDGAVLIDAGTSQTEGGTKGDIDPTCATKARLFSPVPGGIGPITIAKLFENVLTLQQVEA